MGLGNWLIVKIGKYLNKEFPPKRGYLCDFDRICYEIRPADVLLVEGRTRISRIIKRVTQSPWSHAALYLGRMHDIEDPLLREKIHSHYKGKPHEQLIIESIVGKGTFISPLSVYQDDHIRICRPTGLARRDAQRVIAYTLSHLGKSYNMRHFFDLGRFLLASRFIPRRFGSTLFTYDAGQATQDICSAMIASAFESVKFPILPLIRENHQERLEMIHRNVKLFTPSDFDYSPYFNIIKYPLLPIAQTAPYRDLPWRDGLVSDDEVGVRDVKVIHDTKKKNPSASDN